MDMACYVFNDLDHWPSEKLEKGVEIECPSCGALHHMYRGFDGNVNVYLTEDNG